MYYKPKIVAARIIIGILILAILSAMPIIYVTYTIDSVENLSITTRLIVSILPLATIFFFLSFSLLVIGTAFLGWQKKIKVKHNESGIQKNCFVGYHLDIDSNPDYIAACVIQLGSKFKGGIYRVYQKKSKKFYDYAPSKGSLIISNCLYPHEVTKVKAGKRGSLVFFVSYKKGYINYDF